MHAREGGRCGGGDQEEAEDPEGEVESGGGVLRAPGGHGVKIAAGLSACQDKTRTL